MRKISILLICLSTVLLSCERNVLDLSNLESSAVDSSYVNLRVATRVAESFTKSEPFNEGSNARARVAARKLKEVVTVNDSLGKPAFYIINYDNNAGFVIISAERKVYPVLAFNNSGSFQINASVTGASLWMKDLKKTINFIRLDKNATELKGASAKWKEYDKQVKDGEPGSGGTPDPGDGPPFDPGTCPQNVFKANFMSTHWGQGAGHNAYCPIKSGGQCGRAVTGCVATSMLQVMKYHAHPYAVSDSYHSGVIGWGSMPDYTSGNCSSLTYGEDELSRMMASVGDRVNMSYGADESGAYPWKVAQALRDDYLYATSTARYSFNSQDVVTELAWGGPVWPDTLLMRV